MSPLYEFAAFTNLFITFVGAATAIFAASIALTQNDIKDQVDKINEELDINQKKIIKMNFFESKSHKKIAQELEIPLGTVKSRIRHILTKMQEFLR